MAKDVSLAELLAAFGKLEPQERAELAQQINRRFKDSGVSLLANEILSFSALARQVSYYALSLGETGRGKTAGLKPKWTSIVRDYNAFADRVAEPDLLVGSLSDDDLKKFCGFSTRRRGSQKEKIYLSLLLFLIGEQEAGKLADDVFQILLPTGERKFLQQAKHEVAHLINACAEEAKRTVPLPDAPLPHRERPFPEVAISLAYRPERLERFREFFDRHRVPTDNSLHLIVYRGRENSPCDLVKTFLAIYPEKDDPLRESRNILGSLHVYTPPSNDLGRSRHSMGWVVPLEQGLYVLGGQKAEAEQDSGARKGQPRRPFRALELFYFYWPSLESRLLYGLSMTANNDGMPLVSRVCARATPVDRGSKLILGGVRIDQLPKWIREDSKRELKFAKDHKLPASLVQQFHIPQQAESIAGLASAIASHSNNDPRGACDWDVPPGFVKTSHQDDLTRSEVLNMIEKTFGKGGRFRSGDEIFDFWRSIRFGPITARARGGV